jgi:hypothetical protein
MVGLKEKTRWLKARSGIAPIRTSRQLILTPAVNFIRLYSEAFDLPVGPSITFSEYSLAPLRSYVAKKRRHKMSNLFLLTCLGSTGTFFE